MISVIVPVYQVERYLDRCISSILKQTYRDFELILVDDGSPDRCGEICDRWAEKDKRIRIIHKPHGGLSDARNAGIDHARGEYLSFVDSDDWAEPHMLETLYSLLTRCGADMAIASYQIADEAGRKEKKDVRLTAGVWTVEQFWDYYFSGSKTYCDLAWNKLYKRFLFDSLRYPKGKICEDSWIIHDLAEQCSRIAVTDEVVYHYFQRSDSITAQVYTLARLAAPESELNRLERAIEKKNWTLGGKSVLKAKNEFLNVYQRLNEADRKSKEYRQLKKGIISSG
ncbi:MAG: glycosyltransferase family 2 protein [Clostridia bacterium]|nr:glycosyltransferase family 2 protein [Clostridia bacterium]